MNEPRNDRTAWIELTKTAYATASERSRLLDERAPDSAPVPQGNPDDPSTWRLI